MNMGHITDPQIAALLTEQRNLSTQFERVLASQERIERAMVEVAMVKKEQEHLSESDWIVTRSIETAAATLPDWLAYRQALREVPEQTGFPQDIEWPALPENK